MNTRPTLDRLLFATLIAANAIAWIWAWSAFAAYPALLGTAFLAWVFGLRHAVDPDHIAAIDNVVRKLMQSGQRPMSVGAWFSLGHSTVVILACVAIALATTAMQDRFETFKLVGGAIGTGVSSLFLLVIGLVNLFILKGIWGSFQRVRAGGRLDDEGLDRLLSGRGLVTRLLRPVFSAITRPWHMYPVGLLFGLGFDTATEVGLLGISATQAAQGLSPWQILVFPALFTAGMALVDTADSAMMVRAYGWAFVNPLRKLWYNLWITAASVLVALVIGGIEATSLLADRLGLEGGFWRLASSLNEDLTNFGFVIVGVFLGCWLASMALYRLAGYHRLETEPS